MAALKITTENFEKEVLQAEEVVLIDFWASWCGPCKMFSPVIEELAEEVTNAKICKVNVDEEPDLASKYRIMTIPSVVIFKNGEVVAQSAGVKTKAEVLKMLQA